MSAPTVAGAANTVVDEAQTSFSRYINDLMTPRVLYMLPAAYLISYSADWLGDNLGGMLQLRPGRGRNSLKDALKGLGFSIVFR